MLAYVYQLVQINWKKTAKPDYANWYLLFVNTLRAGVRYICTSISA